MPVIFGCGTLTGSMLPRQRATATPIIISPPIANICACHLEMYEDNVAAPRVIGTTTIETPST